MEVYGKTVTGLGPVHNAISTMCWPIMLSLAQIMWLIIQMMRVGLSEDQLWRLVTLSVPG